MDDTFGTLGDPHICILAVAHRCDAVFASSHQNIKNLPVVQLVAGIRLELSNESIFMSAFEEKHTI